MEAKLQQQVPQQNHMNKPNLTGIPTQMKLDFERRSGLSFDDVRVHYNSDKPAQLQALAYTQGTQVYVGPGQERHLPHELGHVIQQKSRKIHPTYYFCGFPINSQPQLEQNADQISMGSNSFYGTNNIIQMCGKKGHNKTRKGNSSKPPKPPKSVENENVRKKRTSTKRQLQQKSQDIDKKSTFFEEMNENLDDKDTVWNPYGRSRSLVYTRINQAKGKHTETIKPKHITGKSLRIKLKLSDTLKKLGYDLQSMSTADQLSATGVYGNADYKDFPIKRVMRWFSSVIGTRLLTPDEVQCYCRPEKKQVLVGLNDKFKINRELKAENPLVNGKNFENLHISDIVWEAKKSPVSQERFERHKANIIKWSTNLPDNIQEKDKDIIKEIFSQYHFVIASVPTQENIANLISKNACDISDELGTLHAEIKILWNVRIDEKNATATVDHTKIGGVRVMCAACFAATNGPQQLENPDIISKKDYMKIIRYGPMWPSMSALRSHFLRRSQRNVLAAFSDLMKAGLPAPLKTLLNLDETSLTLTHRVKNNELVFTATHAHDCDSEDSEEDDVNPASKMEE